MTIIWANKLWWLSTPTLSLSTVTAASFFMEEKVFNSNCDNLAYTSKELSSHQFSKTFSERFLWGQQLPADLFYSNGCSIAWYDVCKSAHGRCLQRESLYHSDNTVHKLFLAFTTATPLSLHVTKFAFMPANCLQVFAMAACSWGVTIHLCTVLGFRLRIFVTLFMLCSITWSTETLTKALESLHWTTKPPSWSSWNAAGWFLMRLFISLQ